MSCVVLKLGGSLLDLSDLRERLSRLIASLDKPVLVVAGGGVIADGVRTVQRDQSAISDEAAHDAAFVTLSASARLVGDLLGMPVTSQWDGLESAVADPQPLLLRAGRLDELPASWDVTSDSIARLIADFVDAEQLVLVKSVAMPESLDAAVESGAIDRHFEQVHAPAAVAWCDLRGDAAVTAIPWVTRESRVASRTPPQETDWIALATTIAAAAHAGQIRKGCATPYIMHPIEVCRVLREHGFDDSHATLHAAALLHDAVEDTPITLDEIRRQFPSDVADWVAWTSEIKTNDDGSKRRWKERKTEHVERLRQAPWQACAIALADKIHNVRDILSAPRDETYWSIFNAPPSELAWYYRSVVDACRRPGRLDDLSATAERVVGELIDVLPAN